MEKEAKILSARTTLLLLGFLLSTGIARPGDDARFDESLSSSRPNIIVIVVDDMRWDEFSAGGHPFLQTPNIDRLAENGMLFENAYHATPLCSPNRASILTGQYCSAHGIKDNVARDRASHRLRLFPIELQNAGYETAHIGKWHMGNEPFPRPGYDHWICIKGQGRIIDPIVYDNNHFDTIPGYITDVLTDKSLAFISEQKEQPFFLYLGHKAVHPDAKQLDDGSLDVVYGSKFIPAEKYSGTYDGAEYAKRGNTIDSYEELDPETMTGLILQAKNTPGIDAEFGNILDHFTSQETIRKRAEMILSVDESVGRIVKTLEDLQILENTFILFTSENGYFFGEHGFSLERRMPYEESVKSPLIVSYPQAKLENVRLREFVISIDIAPTILDLAGASCGSHIHGRSFLPVMEGRKVDWRSSFLMEYYSFENPFPWLIGTDYKALRYEQYKLIHWVKRPDLNELYDLSMDPLEQNNLYGDESYQNILKKMEEELVKQVAAAINIPGY